jgi:hypothetical protein
MGARETEPKRRRTLELVVSRQTDPDFLAQLAEIPDTPVKPGDSVLRPPRLPDAPGRSQVMGRRLTALAASLGWLGVHLAVYGVRTDLHDLPLPYLLAQIALPVMIATGGLFVALGGGKLGLGPKLGLASALAVLGPTSFCVLGLGAPPPHAPSPGDSGLVSSVLCFDLTVAWIALPLLGAAIVLRGAFAAGSRSRSALVGAAIGLFAGATMNLHCPNVAPVHMLFGHGLSVLLAALLGAFALSQRTRA